MSERSYVQRRIESDDEDDVHSVASHATTADFALPAPEKTRPYTCSECGENHPCNHCPVVKAKAALEQQVQSLIALGKVSGVLKLELTINGKEHKAEVSFSKDHFVALLWLKDTVRHAIEFDIKDAVEQVSMERAAEAADLQREQEEFAAKKRKRDAQREAEERQEEQLHWKAMEEKRRKVALAGAAVTSDSAVGSGSLASRLQGLFQSK
jgi:hypothetical protein